MWRFSYIKANNQSVGEAIHNALYYNSTWASAWNLLGTNEVTVTTEQLQSISTNVSKELAKFKAPASSSASAAASPVSPLNQAQFNAAQSSPATSSKGADGVHVASDADHEEKGEGGILDLSPLEVSRASSKRSNSSSLASVGSIAHPPQEHHSFPPSPAAASVSSSSLAEEEWEDFVSAPPLPTQVNKAREIPIFAPVEAALNASEALEDEALNLDDLDWIPSDNAALPAAHNQQPNAAAEDQDIWAAMERNINQQLEDEADKAAENLALLEELPGFSSDEEEATPEIMAQDSVESAQEEASFARAPEEANPYSSYNAYGTYSAYSTTSTSSETARNGYEADIKQATVNSIQESYAVTNTALAIQRSIDEMYHKHGSAADHHSDHTNINVTSDYYKLLEITVTEDKMTPQDAESFIQKQIHDSVVAQSEEVKQQIMANAANDSLVDSLAPGEQKMLLTQSQALFTDSNNKSAEQPAADPNVSETLKAVNHSIVNTAVTDVLGARIDITQHATEGGLGASAGDEEEAKRKGAWLSGIYGLSSQGTSGAASGYKGKLSAGTIGLDGEINESLMLGIAYSNVHSVFKYKHDRTSDKTTAGTHVLSLYSNSKIGEDFIWKNIASISRSNVKTINGRMKNTVTAIGKFKSDSLNFDTNLGYKIAKDGMTFIPNIGLRYGISKDASYKEKRAGFQRQTIGSQKSESLVGSLGTKVMFGHEMTNGIKLTPSLHASVDPNLMDKVQKVRAKFEYDNNYIKTTADTEAKAAKVAYNIGGGIVAAKGNIEVSANYNLNLAKKYQAHQGSLKLKVMF